MCYKFLPKYLSKPATSAISSTSSTLKHSIISYNNQTLNVFKNAAPLVDLMLFYLTLFLFQVFFGL